MIQRKSLAGAAALLAFAATASAQAISSYGFTQTAGTYVPIVGGTQIAVATSAATLDDNTYAVTLPFAFTFNNASYTTIQVQTNGHIAFGATSPGTQYGPLSSTAVVPGFAAAFGRDLQGGFAFTGDRTLGSDQLVNVSSLGPVQVGDQLVGTGIPTGTTVLAITGNVITMSAQATAAGVGTLVSAYGPWAEMRHETQGTPGNQVFIVQWSGFRRYGTTLTTVKDMTLNFQIRLYEANGAIEFVYGNCSPGTTTYATGAQVGLRGATNAFPAEINNRLNTKGVNDDWINSVPGTTNSSSMLFNNVAPANVIANGLTYTFAPPVGIPATNTTYGTGCYTRARASFYELHTDAALASAALTGQSMTVLPAGSEYLATWGGGAYVAPSGTAATLAVSDDSEVSQPLSTGFPTPAGTVTNIMVHGNGLITMGATAQTFTGGNSYTPNTAVFLGAGQTAFWSWHDYNASEAGSGSVKFEEALDANNDLIAYITWDGVENYSTPTAANPSTMQFQLTLTGANAGRVTYVWQSIDNNTTSTFGSAHLVGYSPGGANLDPGSVVLATALPIITGPDVAALALSASNTAVLGTSVTYTTTNIPATAMISADIISFGQINPGIDLGFMGAPGCLQLVDLTVSSTTLLIGGPTATLVFPIPNDPGLAGLPLNLQSASLDPTANALGVLTSNGVRSIVGNF
jgi:hypothetical protein